MRTFQRSEIRGAQMESFDFSGIKTACIDAVLFAVRLAIILGLVGALIGNISPDTVAYWHAASLTVIVLTVVVRSIACARIAWRQLLETE